MNISNKKPPAAGARRGTLLGAIVAALMAPWAQAVTIDINATFTPDSANPHINQFTNTTPNSGMCATYPQLCSSQGLFSIRLGFEAQSQRPILANHANIRDGMMIKVPADPRALQVMSASGDTAQVDFSISAFSAGNRTRDVRLITGIPRPSSTEGNYDLWNGKPWGYYAPSPCTLGAGMGSTPIDANYFWMTPQAMPCGISPAYEIDSLRLRNTSVAYRMTAPDPLKMESGIYTGSITYTVGPGMDFDFGDVMLPTDNQVIMNFTLEVRHTLKFLFPAGDNRVVLSPAGGWQQWLNNGRRPEKLVANKNFKMWSSSQFSMELQCEYLVATQCAIQNAAGHTVPVETRVTLPSGMLDALNRPVERVLLSTTPAVFSPSHYVDNGQASLHFEVARDQTHSMINDHSGSTYRGNITVIWDSEI